MEAICKTVEAKWNHPLIHSHYYELAGFSFGANLMTKNYCVNFHSFQIAMSPDKFS